jgi:histidine ammonia-lyase
VGASGDLIPLAYATQALRGAGYAYVGAERMVAAAALDAAGLTPLSLDGRDALALVNGTSLTAAAAGLAVASAERSQLVSMVLSALLADVLGSDPGYLSPPLVNSFGHPEVSWAADTMRSLLDGTSPSGVRALQEPYSIRCAPHLIGSVAMSVRHAAEVVSHDLNGISDNPLFFPDTGEVAHGGNFFGQPAAFAADLLSLAVVQLGNLAERQLDLLIDPARNNGLPPMLSPTPGEQHSVQGVQLAATATLGWMRRHATPASVQSIPTNLHNQDVVPFGTQAALNALELTRQLRYLHGALAVALRQAVYVGGRSPCATRCAEVMAVLMDVVPGIDADRPLDLNIEAAADALDRYADEQRSGVARRT